MSSLGGQECTTWFLNLVKKIHTLADIRIAKIEQEHDLICGKVSCKGYCCQLRTEGSLAEAFLQYHYCKENDIFIDLQELKKYVKIAEKYQYKTKEFSLLQLPCPFQDKNNFSCKIYPVRPLRCREFYSFDIDNCYGVILHKRTDKPILILHTHLNTALIQLSVLLKPFVCRKDILAGAIKMFRKSYQKNFLEILKNPDCIMYENFCKRLDYFQEMESLLDESITKNTSN